MKPSRSSQQSTKKNDTMSQQNISSMLGERVKKPRTFTEPVQPPSKRQKTVESHQPLPKAKIESPQEQPTETPAPKPTQVQVQKKRWRLEQLIKQDRETKSRVQSHEPSFVFTSPHIDSKRPATKSICQSKPPLPKKTSPSASAVGSKKSTKRNYIVDVLDAEPCDDKKALSANPEVSPSKAKTAHRSGPSGGEALLYDISALPGVHALLLNILSALESAVSLLKTRKTLPTVAAVREIVTRSTRRDFTIRLLSQLAHVVPEAVAVLPPAASADHTARPSDNLLIRLDDCSAASLSGKGFASAVGDSHARLRRSLLHRRLVEHVQEHHDTFVEANGGKSSFKGVWHPDFDADSDVPELPAPPLYPHVVPSKRGRVEVEKRDEGKSTEKKEEEHEEKEDKDTVGKIATKRSRVETDLDANADKDLSPAAKKLRDDDSKTESTRIEPSEEGVSKDIPADDCIPQGLLDKVRARQTKKESTLATVEVERTTNKHVLEKLPCTMDTIATIMRSERRIVMGWSQLVQKLTKMHPRKWPKEDILKQLDLIVELAPAWCKKVALKSSRGGFAFRVVREDSFNEARQHVEETKEYEVVKKENVDDRQ